MSPVNSLQLSANLTLIDNDGPDETYQRLKFIRPLPDGTFEKVFEEIDYPYDIGASSLLNITATWQPAEELILFSRLGYIGSRPLVDPINEHFSSVDSVWIWDASISLKNLFSDGLDLEVSAQNLTDRDYEVPGTYGVIDGQPFTVELIMRKRW